MTEITRELLLEAGCHFGHPTKRWNPKMLPYIYTIKNAIHIIDLQKTKRKLEEACQYVKEVSQNGGKVLYVGTKKQAKKMIEDSAIEADCPYVCERWLGGTLTNFKTIKTSVKALIDIENKEKSGEIKLLPKKEQLLLSKEKERLTKNLGGIRNMYKLPDAIFITDTLTNNTAYKEALKLGIKIIAICDTNSDPDNIDYIIPSNDDATKSIALITKFITEAIIEGQSNNSNSEAGAKAHAGVAPLTGDHTQESDEDNSSQGV